MTVERGSLPSLFTDVRCTAPGCGGPVSMAGGSWECASCGAVWDDDGEGGKTAEELERQWAELGFGDGVGFFLNDGLTR